MKGTGVGSDPGSDPSGMVRQSWEWAIVLQSRESGRVHPREGNCRIMIRVVFRLGWATREG